MENDKSPEATQDNEQSQSQPINGTTNSLPEEPVGPQETSLLSSERSEQPPVVQTDQVPGQPVVSAQVTPLSAPSDPAGEQRAAFASSEPQSLAPQVSEPTAFTSNAQAGPIAMGSASAPAVAPQTSMASSLPTKSRKKQLAKVLVLTVAALAVLGGGSAAAYFGIVVPNKPENVLQSALLNTLQQKHVSFSGTLHEQPATGTGIAVKDVFNGQADAEKGAADVHMLVTVSGVDLSVDARYVGKDLYFRLGDLKTIESLLNSYSPLYGSMVQSLDAQVSNKWIKVDSTLLDSAGVSCVMDTKLTLSDKDVQLLQEQYKQHPFVTILSTSSDTVNGKKVEKYVLSLDDDKAAKFTNNLGSFSMVKSLQGCDKTGEASKASDSMADHDKTPLTVWIDKVSKQIVQVATQTTAKDAKKDNIKGDTTITLDYSKPVNIAAPASSTPLLQLLGQVQGGSNDDTSRSSDFMMM